MLTIITKGDKFKRLNGFLERCKDSLHLGVLDKYGQLGVDALIENTPKETGLLASSWYYEIRHDKKGASIVWMNSDIEGGYNVAILIQYGHATKSGTFVEGIDYINPSLKPVFDQIAEDLWKEVIK